MGITPDFMVRADDVKAWWETDRKKAVKIDADAGLDVWAKAGGIDFAVEAMDSGYRDGDGNWHVANNRKTIVRKDTNAALGWFSGRYKAHQPREIRDFFESFVLADERFKLSTLGSMKGGALIWALAKFHDAREIAGDKHDLFCLLGTSYNGMWATFASATAIRAVCQNTIEASIYGAAPTFRVPHNAAFDSVKQASAAKALAGIAGQFDAYKTMAESLAMQEMSRAQVLAFLSELVTGKSGTPTADEISGRTAGRMANLVDALSQTLAEPANVATIKESDNLNAWVALNSVTRFVDHMRTARRTNDGETSEQARLHSANFGDGAAMKSTAYAKLHALLNTDAQQAIKAKLAAAEYADAA